MIQRHAFWRWFASRNAEYLFINEVEPDHYIAMEMAMLDNLHTYCEHLNFAIDDMESIAKLVISADGDPDYFDAAEALASAAPPMARWEVIALMPMCYPVYIKLPNGTVTDIRHWKVSPQFTLADNTKLTLHVAMPQQDYDAVKFNPSLLRKVVMATIGERAFAERISNFTILPPGHSDSHWYVQPFIPLVELVEYLDRFSAIERWKA